MERGLIHIYCGDGKGKTTAAVGLSVRAAGSGRRVVFAQFFKDGTSGECAVLEKVPGITFVRPEKSFGFFWTLSETEKAEARDFYERLRPRRYQRGGTPLLPPGKAGGAGGGAHRP